jgi:hypothetical protein
VKLELRKATILSAWGADYPHMFEMSINSPKVDSKERSCKRNSLAQEMGIRPRPGQIVHAAQEIKFGPPEGADDLIEQQTRHIARMAIFRAAGDISRLKVLVVLRRTPTLETGDLS